MPTDVEWTVLKDYLTANGHSGAEGIALKATSGWSSENGTDSYGWLGLPGGYRSGNEFIAMSNLGYWWSSSEYEQSPTDALNTYLGDINGLYTVLNSNRTFGDSVRCLRD